MDQSTGGGWEWAILFGMMLGGIGNVLVDMMYRKFSEPTGGDTTINL